MRPREGLLEHEPREDSGAGLRFDLRGEESFKVLAPRNSSQNIPREKTCSQCLFLANEANDLHNFVFIKIHSELVPGCYSTDSYHPTQQRMVKQFVSRLGGCRERLSILVPPNRDEDRKTRKRLSGRSKLRSKDRSARRSGAVL